MIQRQSYTILAKVFVRSVCRALFLLHVLGATGYSWQADSGRQFESSSSDVSLSIRTLNYQSVFRIGEVILLELSFTSTVPNKYRVGASSFDEYSNFFPDNFTVEPDTGWDDPRTAYLDSCPVYVMSGGLQSIIPKMLSQKPTVVVLDLNERMRFNDPGTYHITIHSDRVVRLNSPLGIGAVRLHSNALPLTVVPATEHWQQQTLDSAVAVLDSPMSVGDLPWAQNGDRRNAAKVLQFLGTAAAAREMGRRYQDWAHDFLLELVESPARDAAFDQMTALFVNPYFPVNSQFICGMSVASVLPELTDKTSAQRMAAEARFREELSSALKDKQGQALATSTETVQSEPVVR